MITLSERNQTKIINKGTGERWKVFQRLYCHVMWCRKTLKVIGKLSQVAGAFKDIHDKSINTSPIHFQIWGINIQHTC
jgi:hypothetical protein